MNRKEREIRDDAEIESLIREAKVCRLGMTGEQGYPYVVPLCFGYQNKTLYFHCAEKGLKTALLRKNPKVCFEMDICKDVKYLSRICDWGMFYKSIIGFGDVEFLESGEEKKEALDILVRHYGSELMDDELNYPAVMLKNTLLFKVNIRSMTGKKSG